MNRSEINAIIDDAIKFINMMNYMLPPFAFWSPEEWTKKGHEFDEIRDNMLGWDITDFGSRDYSRIGLLMFTIRNGNYMKPRYTKPYAEKILIAEEEQVTPFHFHWKKMEDIINRGGGDLLVEIYNSTEDDQRAQSPVMVYSDGRNYVVPAGSIIRIRPGESITLPPRQYHQFWADEGKGKVLLGEVSKVNDDTIDNHFLNPVGRFPDIVEDEKPRYLLGNEYPAAK